MRGQWIYPVSTKQCEVSGSGAGSLCIQWYISQLQNKAMLNMYLFYVLPPCPCHYQQALIDPRFYVDRSTGCAVTTRFLTVAEVTQDSLNSEQNYMYCKLERDFF